MQFPIKQKVSVHDSSSPMLDNSITIRWNILALAGMDSLQSLAFKGWFLAYEGYIVFAYS